MKSIRSLAKSVWQFCSYLFVGCSGAGGDDDGATDKGTEGLEDFLAKLLQNGDLLMRNRIVDSILVSCG